VLQYYASVVGLALVIRPVLVNHNGMGSMKPGDIAKYYVSVSRIMQVGHAPAWMGSWGGAG
jgi:hypothetical protein